MLGRSGCTEKWVVILFGLGALQTCHNLATPRGEIAADS